MSGEKAVTRQHLQDSLEAALQALNAAGERLAEVEGETPFLRTLAEAQELGAELLRRSKVHDDTAELVEALRSCIEPMVCAADVCEAEGASAVAWACRAAVESARAVLARVKGGER